MASRTHLDLKVAVTIQLHMQLVEGNISVWRMVYYLFYWMPGVRSVVQFDEKDPLIKAVNFSMPDTRSI